MDTQLVRLDAPYNIICGKTGEIGLHIATLIVVKEQLDGVKDGAPLGDTLIVANYPVVNNVYKGEGQAWLHTEVKDALVIGRQKESVTIYSLKRVVEYCAKQNVRGYASRIPALFSWAMSTYGVSILLDYGKDTKKIVDYEVELIFEEGNRGDDCMVYSTNDSRFYFYEYFRNMPPIGADYTNTEAIKRMAELRNSYLKILKTEGLRSITFITKNIKYKWFVDQLNSSKTDGQGV